MSSLGKEAAGDDEGKKGIGAPTLKPFGKFTTAPGGKPSDTPPALPGVTSAAPEGTETKPASKFNFSLGSKPNTLGAGSGSGTGFGFGKSILGSTGAASGSTSAGTSSTLASKPVGSFGLKLGSQASGAGASAASAASTVTATSSASALGASAGAPKLNFGLTRSTASGPSPSPSTTHQAEGEKEKEQAPQGGQASVTTSSFAAKPLGGLGSGAKLGGFTLAKPPTAVGLFSTPKAEASSAPVESTPVEESSKADEKSDTSSANSNVSVAVLDSGKTDASASSSQLAPEAESSQSFPAVTQASSNIAKPSAAAPSQPSSGIFGGLKSAASGKLGIGAKPTTTTTSTASAGQPLRSFGFSLRKANEPEAKAPEQVSDREESDGDDSDTVPQPRGTSLAAPEVTKSTSSASQASALASTLTKKPSAPAASTPATSSFSISSLPVSNPAQTVNRSAQPECTSTVAPEPKAQVSSKPLLGKSLAFTTPGGKSETKAADSKSAALASGPSIPAQSSAPSGSSLTRAQDDDSKLAQSGSARSATTSTGVAQGTSFTAMVKESVILPIRPISSLVEAVSDALPPSITVAPTSNSALPDTTTSEHRSGDNSWSMKGATAASRKVSTLAELSGVVARHPDLNQLHVRRLKFLTESLKRGPRSSAILKSNIRKELAVAHPEKAGVLGATDILGLGRMNESAPTKSAPRKVPYSTNDDDAVTTYSYDDSEEEALLEGDETDDEMQADGEEQDPLDRRIQRMKQRIELARASYRRANLQPLVEADISAAANHASNQLIEYSTALLRCANGEHQFSHLKVEEPGTSVAHDITTNLDKGVASLSNAAAQVQAAAKVALSGTRGGNLSYADEPVFGSNLLAPEERGLFVSSISSSSNELTSAHLPLELGSDVLRALADEVYSIVEGKPVTSMNPETLGPHKREEATGLVGSSLNQVAEVVETELALRTGSSSGWPKISPELELLLDTALVSAAKVAAVASAKEMAAVSGPLYVALQNRRRRRKALRGYGVDYGLPVDTQSDDEQEFSPEGSLEPESPETADLSPTSGESEQEIFPAIGADTTQTRTGKSDARNDPSAKRLPRVSDVKSALKAESKLRLAQAAARKSHALLASLVAAASSAAPQTSERIACTNQGHLLILTPITAENPAPTLLSLRSSDLVSNGVKAKVREVICAMHGDVAVGLPLSCDRLLANQQGTYVAVYSRLTCVIVKLPSTPVERSMAGTAKKIICPAVAIGARGGTSLAAGWSELSSKLELSRGKDFAQGPDGDISGITPYTDSTFLPGVTIEQVAWHPLSSSHLMILYSNGALALFDVRNWSAPERLFDLHALAAKNQASLFESLNTDADSIRSKRSAVSDGSTYAGPQSSHLMTPGVTAAGQNASTGDGVAPKASTNVFVSFTFGSALKCGWNVFTVYLMTSRGTFFALCPVVPNGAVIPMDIIAKLRTEAEVLYQKLTASLVAAQSAVESMRSKAQRRAEDSRSQEQNDRLPPHLVPRYPGLTTPQKAPSPSPVPPTTQLSTTSAQSMPEGQLKRMKSRLELAAKLHQVSLLRQWIDNIFHVELESDNKVIHVPRRGYPASPEGFVTAHVLDNTEKPYYGIALQRLHRPTADKHSPSSRSNVRFTHVWCPPVSPPLSNGRRDSIAGHSSHEQRDSNTGAPTILIRLAISGNTTSLPSGGAGAGGFSSYGPSPSGSFHHDSGDTANPASGQTPSAVASPTEVTVASAVQMSSASAKVVLAAAEAAERGRATPYEAGLSLLDTLLQRLTPSGQPVYPSGTEPAQVNFEDSEDEEDEEAKPAATGVPVNALTMAGQPESANLERDGKKSVPPENRLAEVYSDIIMVEDAPLPLFEGQSPASLHQLALEFVYNFMISKPGKASQSKPNAPSVTSGGAPQLQDFRVNSLMLMLSPATGSSTDYRGAESEDLFTRSLLRMPSAITSSSTSLSPRPGQLVSIDSLNALVQTSGDNIPLASLESNQTLAHLSATLLNVLGRFPTKLTFIRRARLGADVDPVFRSQVQMMRGIAEDALASSLVQYEMEERRKLALARIKGRDQASSASGGAKGISPESTLVPGPSPQPEARTDPLSHKFAFFNRFSTSSSVSGTAFAVKRGLASAIEIDPKLPRTMLNGADSESLVEDESDLGHSKSTTELDGLPQLPAAQRISTVAQQLVLRLLNAFLAKLKRLQRIKAFVAVSSPCPIGLWAQVGGAGEFAVSIQYVLPSLASLCSVSTLCSFLSQHSEIAPPTHVQEPGSPMHRVFMLALARVLCHPAARRVGGTLIYRVLAPQANELRGASGTFSSAQSNVVQLIYRSPTGWDTCQPLDSKFATQSLNPIVAAVKQGASPLFKMESSRMGFEVSGESQPPHSLASSLLSGFVRVVAPPLPEGLLVLSGDYRATILPILPTLSPELQGSESALIPLLGTLMPGANENITGVSGSVDVQGQTGPSGLDEFVRTMKDPKALASLKSQVEAISERFNLATPACVTQYAALRQSIYSIILSLHSASLEINARIDMFNKLTNAQNEALEEVEKKIIDCVNESVYLQNRFNMLAENQRRLLERAVRLKFKLGDVDADIPTIAEQNFANLVHIAQTRKDEVARELQKLQEEWARLQANRRQVAESLNRAASAAEGLSSRLAIPKSFHTLSQRQAGSLARTKETLDQLKQRLEQAIESLKRE